MSANDSCGVWFELENYRAHYVVLGVLNACMAVITTTSNGLVLVAIWKTSSLQTPSTVLLFSLALSDFGVGLLVQPLFVLTTLAHLQGQYPLYCLTNEVFILTSGVFNAVSLANVTYVGVERLVALKLHLRYYAVITVKRVVILLVATWIDGVATVSTYLWSDLVYRTFLFTGTFVFLFASILVYFKILRIRNRHLTTVRAQESAIAHHYSRAAPQIAGTTRERKYAISILYVYCLMLLCYLPFAICLTVIHMTGTNPLKEVAYKFTQTAIFSNSLLNPLMYCWRIQSIRAAMKRILLSCKRQLFGTSNV